MQIGLQLPDFTSPHGPERLGDDLAEVARVADTVGFDYLAVMDHFFQIPLVGPAENEMLEAYTTLGFLAAQTRDVNLLTLVTGTVYREPAVLAKIITTLDVLSGGRAWLGVGAAWYEEETRALGLPFPPVGERFERLEETVRICLQMWGDSEDAFEGRHYRLARTLNSPQALTRPHPPIMIGGGGEKKTLRLVARYAQACNLFAGPELPHKLRILREHCDREGRDYEDILRTVVFSFDVGKDGEKVPRILDELYALSELGIQAVIGDVRDVWRIEPLHILGDLVIPQVADLPR